MDFKMPSITIATDASPSSNEGLIRASCVLNGETVEVLARYMPTTGFDSTHSLAVMDAVANLKRKVAEVHGVGEASAVSGNSASTDIIGRLVRLKSDGWTMTAAKLADDGGILCVWSNAGGVHQQSIPLAALEIVEPFKHIQRENIGCIDADALARLNDQAAAASMKFSPFLRESDQWSKETLEKLQAGGPTYEKMTQGEARNLQGAGAYATYIRASEKQNAGKMAP